MPLVVLVGASGSGKTTIANAIAGRFARDVDVFFFDRIGVPPLERMIAEHGSGEAWQRARTIDWLGKLAPSVASGRRVLFEGQTRLAFVAEGAAMAGLAYRPILIDCDDASRARRLTVDLQQPELANADMLNWARYLRREARETGCEILDTTHMSLDDAVSFVVARLDL